MRKRKAQLKRIAKMYSKIYYEYIFTERAGFIYGLLKKAEGFNPPCSDVPF